MINIKKIKKLEILEDIKKTLEFYINAPIIKKILLENGDDPLDIEDNMEDAKSLLKEVNNRLAEIILKKSESQPSININ